MPSSDILVSGILSRACGEVFEYNEEEFMIKVRNGYIQKEVAFFKMFTQDMIIVCPKDFYDYIDRENGILGKIKKLLKHHK